MKKITITIRKATKEDAPAIAAIHVASWQTTYKGIMNDKYLSNLSVEQRTSLWEHNVALTDNMVLVAELDGRLIGFSSGAAANQEEYPAYDGDVTSIYFYEEFQGRGFGKLLMDALLHEFKIRGYNSAIVKVLEDNKNRYFYEKLGATLIDETTMKIAGDELTLLTYGWYRI